MPYATVGMAMRNQGLAVDPGNATSEYHVSCGTSGTGRRCGPLASIRLLPFIRVRSGRRFRGGSATIALTTQTDLLHRQFRSWIATS